MLLKNPIEMQLKHNNSKFKKKEFSIIIITDKVARPANLGGLIRTVDAFGVKKIIFGGENIKLNRKTFYSSRSTEKIVDFEINKNLIKTTNSYKKRGYKVLALEITKTSKPITKFKVNNDSNFVLIVGSERFGIDNNLLHLCDEVYHIQMYGQNSSMNVVQATSIGLYEITNKICIC